MPTLTYFNQFIRRHGPLLLLGTAILLGLLWIAQSNYLLFHVLGEMFSIVIAFTIFVLTWNGRGYLHNGYLVFLGISFLFTGGIDLLHTLAFRGMGVFPGTGQSDPNAANLATQLWIAARYMQALSLVFAPVFLRRQFRPSLVLAGYTVITALLVLSIFEWRVFPDALLDAGGLTEFKKSSEYLIILLLTVGGLGLLRVRSAFDPDVRRLLMLAIVTTILSEFAFVEYLMVTDGFNQLGHFLKIVAFYLIYKAIIETGFLKPQDLLFRELAQSERALRESSQRERARNAELEAIMDAVPAVVWIAHDQESSLITGNRASVDLLHVPSESNQSMTAPNGLAPSHFQVYGKDGSELAPEELPLQVSAATGQPVRDFEETIVFSDGERHHMYGNVSPLLDEQGRPAGAVGAFIDITARVQIEKALQESEARYRGLFQTMGEAFSLHEILLDEQGRPVDYTFDEVNPAFEQMTGFKREQVVGKTINEIVPDRSALWIERYAQVAFTGESIRFEEYSAMLDKYFEQMVYAVDERHVAALSVDVSDRYRSQEALRQSEARLRRLVDSNIIGIMYSDERGHLSLANDACLQIVGYSRADLEAGQINWEAITPPEYEHLDRQAIQEAYQRGACTPYEKEYVRKDGSRVPVLIGFAHFEGPPSPFICFVIDLSPQKQAEAAVRGYAAQLEHINRELERANDELQNFAFVASHDLQEPLRKIQAFGERLKARLKDHMDADSLDYMERMLNASIRMRTMINDLLSLSRVTTRGKPFEQVDLDSTARDVVSDLEVTIERASGTMVVDDLPTIQADSVQMHQLLQNLVSNALKFHKANVPPVVRLYSHCQEETGHVNIFVEDNGIGFDEQYLDRIFQPFQRLHGRTEFEGSGIGLAVCRKIAERHSGFITARSVPGEGSTFIVTLPMRQDGRVD